MKLKNEETTARELKHKKTAAEERAEVKFAAAVKLKDKEKLAAEKVAAAMLHVRAQQAAYDEAVKVCAEARNQLVHNEVAAKELLKEEFEAVKLLSEEFPALELKNKEVAKVKLKEGEFAAAAPRARARAPWPRCSTHTHGVGS